MKGLIKFVVGRFCLKGDDKSVKKRRCRKMGTIGGVSCIGTTQKRGKNKKFFLVKGLTNPSLKFLSERAYQICRWAFFSKRGYKSVKKRRYLKIGTIDGVSSSCTIQKWGKADKFVKKRRYPKTDTKNRYKRLDHH